MHLTVVLGTDSEVSFDISLNQNSFTEKWIEELKWCLSNCDFNQEEAFSRFLTKEQVESKLLDACNTINKYLKNFIDIEKDFTNQSQTYFNYLHKQFERLSGEFGKPTRLFKIANRELKNAIRNLNFYTHRLEGNSLSEFFYLSFCKDQYRRQKLHEDDYKFFQFTAEKGSLILHYAELGKTYYDVYKDGLEFTYPGLKNLHYYSAETSLISKDYNIEDDLGYIDWLKFHNIDPFDKMQGHGIICLGKVLDLDAAYNKLANNRHIKQIIIKD
jgi:hypothetical protein